jgi:hypothetical protein
MLLVSATVASFGCSLIHHSSVGRVYEPFLLPHSMLHQCVPIRCSCTLHFSRYTRFGPTILADVRSVKSDGRTLHLAVSCRLRASTAYWCCPSSRRPASGLAVAYLSRFNQLKFAIYPRLEPLTCTLSLVRTSQDQRRFLIHACALPGTTYVHTCMDYKSGRCGLDGSLEARIVPTITRPFGRGAWVQESGTGRQACWSAALRIPTSNAQALDSR